MFYCDRCSTSFTRKDNLAAHARRKSCKLKVKKLQLECKKCKKQFESTSGLKKHEFLRICEQLTGKPHPAVNPNLCFDTSVYKNVSKVNGVENLCTHDALRLNEPSSLSWNHPFTCMVAGPTSCGKTVFVLKLLEHIDAMVDTSIHEIIWCYGEVQPFHSNIKTHNNIPITFREGIPSMNDIAPESSPPPRLVIIDDLMREANGNVVDLFSKGSHHRNLSIIFITQNLFHQGKGSRDMSLNAHYIVLFKNPRDKSQIHHFSRQVSPENPTFVHEIYLDATSKPHSYLLFDLKQLTPDAFRFRTDIFPGESNFVYVPKCAGSEYSQYFYK